jgi:predicted dehydrogenase
MLLRSVGFGVIGLGQFGEKHTHVLSALPNVRLVAVCSRRVARAEEVASKYGAERYYTDVKDLVRDKEIEAVSIATAENEHLEPTLAAAEAGKHILLEKPIALSLSDADEMIEATRKASVFFMIGHILRFETRYAMAKEEIEAGRIGKVVAIYARRNIPARVSGGSLQRVSSIVGDSIHDTDLMLWYTRDKIVRVYSDAANVKEMLNQGVTWTVYKFKDGGVGVVEAARLLRDNTPFNIDARMEIIGTEGAIYIDLSDECIQVNDREGFRMPDTVHWPVMHGKRVGALKEEIAYFADCVMNCKEPTVIRPEEARTALEAVLAAERSAKTQTPVTL